ncbi:MAG: hypothetical protein JWM56_251 [Candidatus Peribacteria bacterium]|nr:hypothetical protein [Candidatus Peribacteria bacterium]
MDRRLGIERPEGPPFTLNNTVDLLMKREFDIARREQKATILMQQYSIDAVPLEHPDLADWRDPWKGITALHEPTQFIFFGAVDDVWVNTDGELLIVDYKATSSQEEVSLRHAWKDSYKRQIEMYQWLFRHNGFVVSDMAYFVYVNADKGRESFDGRLEFTTRILPYKGNDDWVDDALAEAKICLFKETLPQAAANCEWCAYRKEAATIEVPNSKL